jgi:hypothetical protein
MEVGKNEFQAAKWRPPYDAVTMVRASQVSIFDLVRGVLRSPPEEPPIIVPRKSEFLAQLRARRETRGSRSVSFPALVVSVKISDASFAILRQTWIEGCVNDEFGVTALRISSWEYLWVDV